MEKLHIVFLLNLAAILLSLNCFAVETALTVTRINETPVDIPFEDVDDTNGNSASNRTADVFFIIDLPSGAAGSATVTFTAQTTTTEVSGFGVLTKSNLAVALSPGETKVVGPFPARAWNDSNGNIIMAHTGTGAADIDIAALRSRP